MKKIYFLLLFICISQPALGKALSYHGSMESAIEMNWERVFRTNSTQMLEVEFAHPTDHDSRYNKQKVRDFHIQFSLEPDQKEVRTDAFGNIFTIARWENLPNTELSCKIHYIVDLNITLQPTDLRTPFPIDSLPSDVEKYLSATEFVQKDDAEIIDRASSLARGEISQFDVVTNIFNWLVDNIVYIYNVPQNDALYTLQNRQGNCENYAHLACAMLRSLEIPARFVGGFTVNRPWTVTTRGGGKLTLVNGESRHAWIEVYFPEIGWVQFDPQQSQFLVSTRHIRNNYGLDANDVREKLRAIPFIPHEDEYIQPTFLSDENNLEYKKKYRNPANHIIKSFVNVVVPEEPIVFEESSKTMYGASETEEIEEEEEGFYAEPNWQENLPAPKDLGNGLVEIGFGSGDINEIYEEPASSSGYKSNASNQETFLYVTEAGSSDDPQIYAQAFYLDKSMEVSSIYLLMHNFGGNMGKVWVELRKDKNGSPAFNGQSSQGMVKDGAYIHGYSWFQFDYQRKPKLELGKWWIVVRHDGNAIVNWRCIWGNPYGDPDDTKSTRRMTNKWNNIVNVDFNFKVIGKMD